MRSSEVRKRIRDIVSERQNEARQRRREDEWGGAGHRPDPRPPTAGHK